MKRFAKKKAELIKFKRNCNAAINNLHVAEYVINHIIGEADVSLVGLPARKEKIGNVLLDGGHNADAAKFLAESISDETAVIGMMADKDIDAYLSIVAPKCKKIITTKPDNPRAIPAKDLKKLAQKYCRDVIAIDNPLEAVSQKDVTLICGSFFLARDVRYDLIKSNGLS